MDDATLNPEADKSQGPRADLGRIVEQVEAKLGPVGGTPQPLDGGITNRNYKLAFGGDDYVIRVPGKDTNLLGIDREAECFANKRAAEIGIAPPVALMLSDPPAIVTTFVAGHPMSSAELGEPPARVTVAASLRAFHGSAEPLTVEFNAFRIVERYAELAAERGAVVPGAFGPAREWAARIEETLVDTEHSPVPCHNDLLAANFIADEEDEGRLWIVDWEYAGMGDRYFDLANFAINNGLEGQAQAGLVADYFETDASDASAGRRLAALRLMIFMSDFREAMWGVLQSAVSEIEFDFSGYAGQHFERLETTAADPRFEGLLAEAAA